MLDKTHTGGIAFMWLLLEANFIVGIAIWIYYLSDNIHSWNSKKDIISDVILSFLMFAVGGLALLVVGYLLYKLYKAIIAFYKLPWE